MNDPANPVRINEKWIVTIIWTSLLLLLYLTTSNGVVTGFGGNVRSFYAAFFANGVFPDRSAAIIPVVFVTAIVTLALAVALVYQLYDAWSKFISLTNQILIAFVQSSTPGERNPILFELLNFRILQKEQKATEGNGTGEGDTGNNPDEEVIETNPDEAIGSVIGSVLRAIAFSWAIIILTPGIIVLASIIAR